MEKHSRVCAHIDLDAVLFNAESIYQNIDPNSKIMAVIKTDGYGHGAVEIARELEHLDYIYGYGVATVEEGIILRKKGMRKPILILGYVFREHYYDVVKYDIAPAVFTIDMARDLSNAAIVANKNCKIHLAVDTGMGRIGFDLVADKEKAFEEMKQLLELPNLRFTGLYSHFPAADSFDEFSVQYTEKQIELFNEAYDYLTRYGFDFKIVHGQNSAGILRKLNGRFNAMRAGIILYGMCPSDSLAGGDLTPVMEIKTVVTHVKDIKKDQYVGYGLNFKAEMPMTVATVAIGYADGLPRFLKKKDYTMNINGVDYPLIAVCMDQCMLDVTFGNVKIGDEVVAMGGTGAQNFDRIAKMTGTINYEIPCGIQRRVPKVFMEDDKVVFVENNME